MIRILSLFLRFILFVASALICASYFMTFNQYKSKLENFFQNTYSLNLSIERDIKFSFFPKPHLEIESLLITDQSDKRIYSGNMNLYINHNILMNKEISECINSIVAIDSKLDLEKFFKYFQSSQDNKIAGAMPSIQLTNIDISIGHQCISCIQIEHLNLIVGGSVFGGSYNLISSFQFNEVKYILDASLEGINQDGHVKNAYVKLYNHIFALELTGSGKNLYQDPEFQGKTSLNIINLKSFFEEMQHLNNEDPEKITKTIFKDRQIIVNTQTLFKNNALKFFDLNISGEGISNFDGFIQMSFIDNGLEWYYDFDASKLDMDYFLSSNISLSEIIFFLDHLNDSKNTAHGMMSSYIDINISEIMLFQQPILNFALNADVASGEFYINSMSCSIPGDGKIDLIGYYSRNKFRPKFDGSLSIVMQDFAKTLKWLNNGKQVNSKIEKVFIQSDLMMIPHRIKFHNIRAAFDDTLMIGRINFIQDANHEKIIESSLKFNVLDLDKFGIDQQVDSIANLLITSDSDKTGKEYSRNVDDHKWLRYIGYNINLDLMAQNTKFKNILLKDFLISTEISPGFFSINNISFKDDSMTQLNGADFTLTLDGLRPKIDTSINFETLHYNFIQRIMPNIDIDPSKADNINTFSLYNFDGPVHASVKKFITNEEDIVANTIADFQLRNGIISLVNFKCNALNGEIGAVGNITAMEYIPQINMNFVLNNINPGLLMKKFTGISKVDGYMSFGGSISSAGNTWPKIIERIRGSGDVIGKNIKWNGFDLNEIISAADFNMSSTDKIARVNYYSDNGSSFFNQLRGRIEINGKLISLNNTSLSNNRASGALAARYNYIDNTFSAIAKYSFFPIGVTSQLTIELQSLGQFPTYSTEFSLGKLLDFINKNNTKISATPKSKANEDLRSPIRRQ